MTIIFHDFIKAGVVMTGILTDNAKIYVCIFIKINTLYKNILACYKSHKIKFVYCLYYAHFDKKKLRILVSLTLYTMEDNTQK
jgi:hypothetical protein